MVLALPGTWIWDSWYLRDGDTWHAWFLQADRGLGDTGLRHWHVPTGRCATRG